MAKNENCLFAANFKSNFLILLKKLAGNFLISLANKKKHTTIDIFHLPGHKMQSTARKKKASKIMKIK